MARNVSDWLLEMAIQSTTSKHRHREDNHESQIDDPPAHAGALGNRVRMFPDRVLIPGRAGRRWISGCLWDAGWLGFPGRAVARSRSGQERTLDDAHGAATAIRWTGRGSGGCEHGWKSQGCGRGVDHLRRAGCHHDRPAQRRPGPNGRSLLLGGKVEVRRSPVHGRSDPWRPGEPDRCRSRTGPQGRWLDPLGLPERIASGLSIPDGEGLSVRYRRRTGVEAQPGVSRVWGQGRCPPGLTGG